MSCTALCTCKHVLLFYGLLSSIFERSLGTRNFSNYQLARSLNGTICVSERCTMLEQGQLRKMDEVKTSANHSNLHTNNTTSGANMYTEYCEPPRVDSYVNKRSSIPFFSFRFVFFLSLFFLFSQHLQKTHSTHTCVSINLQDENHGKDLHRRLDSLIRTLALRGIHRVKNAELVDVDAIFLAQCFTVLQKHPLFTGEQFTEHTDCLGIASQHTRLLC